MTGARPTVAVILDGWGERESADANAVRLANTPNFDRLRATSPQATLKTFGPHVGLPEGQMGNSEVGHLNIGAGRVVLQQLPRIDDAIANRKLAGLIEATGLPDKLRASGGICHVMGLMSDGGVHAHTDHAIAVCTVLTAAGLPVAVHAFTDGRDTSPEALPAQLADLERRLPAGARVATVCGRYFAMDRDNRWERVEKAYRLIVEGTGDHFASVGDAVGHAEADGVTAEFVSPSVIGDYRGIAAGDAILCINFRADRVRELLSALVDPEFAGFDRGAMPHLAAAVGMVPYSADLDRFMSALFQPVSLHNGLSETISKAGLRQMHIAETEKYPHVTYFLNGGREDPFAGEDRQMIPSPKVATYDLQPEMSAPAVTDAVVQAIEGGDYAFVIVNYANPDMVGHTGDLAAAIKAVEAVDEGIGRILDAVTCAGGALIAFADHGNCEEMRDAAGNPHTAHTTNLVPVLVMHPDVRALKDGILADVAPTILALMGLQAPGEMTGSCLFDAGDA